MWPLYSKLYFLYFLDAKNRYFGTKNCLNLLIFLNLFCPKNSTTDSRKTFIIQGWLVVESYPTHYWIAFLMVYRLVCNIHSHLNELTLSWSTYLCVRTCSVSWKNFHLTQHFSYSFFMKPYINLSLVLNPICNNSM